MGDKYWKSFQDLAPVVLTKNTSAIKSSNIKSKSNIHIKSNNNNDNDDEIKPIIYYSSEQINNIRTARQALNLTQTQLANKISNTLKADFITNIENGKTQFDQKTYRTICRALNIKS
jgi:ribosome-binding protein aMBF1 (putative translation factor)